MEDVGGLDLQRCGGVLLPPLSGGELDSRVPDPVHDIPTCPEARFTSPRRGKRPDTDQCPPDFVVIDHVETIVTPRVGGQRRALTEASFDKAPGGELPGCRFRVVFRMRY